MSSFLTRRQVSTRRRAGFTLIELLVVISIIALLVSILLPAINKGRSRSRAVVCGSNLRQIAVSMLVYASENGAGLLDSVYINKMNNNDGWNFPGAGGDVGWLQPYYKSDRICHCPEVLGDPTSANYSAASVGGVSRPDQFSSPTDTVMLGDFETIVGASTRVPYFKDSPAAFDFIKPPSTSDVSSSAFMARHNGMGNVGWYDGHVDSHQAWCNQDYLNNQGVPAPAQKLILQAKMGMIMPDSPANYADFLADARKDYYFWSDKSSAH